MHASMARILLWRSISKAVNFSVAVVDDKAYPIIEIAPIQGFYELQEQISGWLYCRVPARLRFLRSSTAKMQENAVKAAKALGLTGYSRLDFMMKENGDMYCLEANTPGSDSYQSDSSGGEGTGNGLSDALRGTDPDFFKEVRIIYRMFILNIKRIK